MLICNAGTVAGPRVDVRLAAGRIGQVAARLARQPGEAVIDARGGLLLPGLHDHHLHLYATAAALQSLHCGPPEILDEPALRARLIAAASRIDAGGAWLRGVAYHESVAGPLTREQLDAWVPNQPLRIQHRSGRLWMFNSAGLAALGVDEQTGDDPLQRIDGRLSGHLYDADAWLRSRIASVPPSLRALGARLSRYGITGVTDTSHDNDAATWQRLQHAQRRGELAQRLCVMGGASLDAATPGADLLRGAHKFHLHDHALPDFDALCAEIRRSHGAQRPVAFHCVTRGEVVYALAALREAGSLPGDRIEHGGVLPPESLQDLVAMRLCVVTQPHFIFERGDRYRIEVAHEDQPHLYRLRSLIDAGIALAAGSDAPYGTLDPWPAMQAAVTRRTREGQSIGAREALSPEQALALYLAPLAQPGGAPRVIAPGAPADLCLLAHPWREVRDALHRVQPRMTWIGGTLKWDAATDDPL